jgi:ADP-heptose:LPS heptosyltransferase
LDLWDDILRVPGITFVSLQYGPHSTDIEAARKRTGANIVIDSTIDSSGDLDGFAAQVAAMDLVISVSNTTVHMAGALARPVWVLTPTGPGAHWYWFRERADSPWYPAARLFRQDTRGSWEEPVAAVTRELQQWALNQGKRA